MDTAFKGKKFTIANRRTQDYNYDKQHSEWSINALVRDQNGIASKAMISTSGTDTLSTDYMASYYAPVIAKTIARTSKGLSFVKNMAVTTDQWNQECTANDLTWTTLDVGPAGYTKGLESDIRVEAKEFFSNGEK